MSKVFGAGLPSIDPHIRIRGDLSKLYLQTGSKKISDEQGVDSLERIFKCHRDLAPSFEPEKGDFDFRWPHLRVIDWEVVEGAAISEIRVRYNGLPPGFAPIILSRYSTQLLTATLQGPLGTITLRYYSPTLTRSYSLPEQPLYEDPFSVNDFTFDQPIRPVGILAPNGTRLSGTGIDYLATFFKFKVETVRTQNDTPEDGYVVRVTETWRREIVQESSLSLEFLLKASGGGLTAADIAKLLKQAHL